MVMSRYSHVLRFTKKPRLISMTVFKSNLNILLHPCTRPSKFFKNLNVSPLYLHPSIRLYSLTFQTRAVSFLRFLRRRTASALIHGSVIFFGYQFLGKEIYNLRSCTISNVFTGCECLTTNHSTVCEINPIALVLLLAKVIPQCVITTGNPLFVMVNCLFRPAK